MDHVIIYSSKLNVLLNLNHRLNESSVSCKLNYSEEQIQNLSTSINLTKEKVTITPLPPINVYGDYNNKNIMEFLKYMMSNLLFAILITGNEIQLIFDLKSIGSIASLSESKQSELKTTSPILEQYYTSLSMIQSSKNTTQPSSTSRSLINKLPAKFQGLFMSNLIPNQLEESLLLAKIKKFEEKIRLTNVFLSEIWNSVSDISDLHDKILLFKRNLYRAMEFSQDPFLKEYFKNLDCYFKFSVLQNDNLNCTPSVSLSLSDEQNQAGGARKRDPENDFHFVLIGGPILASFIVASAVVITALQIAWTCSYEIPVSLYNYFNGKSCNSSFLQLAAMAMFEEPIYPFETDAQRSDRLKREREEREQRAWKKKYKERRDRGEEEYSRVDYGKKYHKYKHKYLKYKDK